MQNHVRTNRAAALLLALLMLLSVFAGCTGNEKTQGAKTITVAVTHGDGSEKSFELHTDAENLRQALEEEKLVAGEESDYGLYVLTVDGETVNEDNQEWWCLTKGGEMWNYGVDDTNIADGDAYEFTFTVGW